jgi:5-methyltetrahydrofolate--homocysteine methyltransferase
MGDALSLLLAQKDVVLADGAMGTSLFQLGLDNRSSGELWNVEHPDLVAGVHQGFADAGSDILLTNTFGANRYRLGLHKLAERARELNMAAVRIARAVRDKARRPIVIAGDIGPIGDILEPFGTRTVAQAEEAFFEQAQALKEGGVDIAWIETMIADNELDAAIRGVQRAGLGYVATMTFDAGGRTMMGESPEDAMRRIRAAAYRPIAFGANCGVGPAQLMDSVIGLVRGAEGDAIVVAKSNCGIPVLDSEMRVSYNGNPEVMGLYACMARDAGARIIGGCCGTTAQHIKSMSDALARRPKGPAPSYDEIQKILGPVKITTKAG